MTHRWRRRAMAPRLVLSWLVPSEHARTESEALAPLGSRAGVHLQRPHLMRVTRSAEAPASHGEKASAGLQVSAQRSANHCRGRLVIAAGALGQGRLQVWIKTDGFDARRAGADRRGAH